MAWSIPIWKIFGFPKVSLYFGEVRAKTCHISYTNTLPFMTERTVMEK